MRFSIFCRKNYFSSTFSSHPPMFTELYGFTVGFQYCKVKGFVMQNRKSHRSRSSEGVRRQIRLQNYVELHCGSTGNSF